LAVREELGYVLILDGQTASAQYQFEILKERTRDPELRMLHTAVLRRIVAERPVGISIIFGHTAASNLNQGTVTVTIYNDVLGTGAIAQVSLDWRAERHVYALLYTPENEAELGLLYAREMVRHGSKALVVQATATIE